MRRWMAAPVLAAAIAAVFLSAEPPQAAAQGNEPAEETFMTADGMQLHGMFTKSTKTPGSDPVVILLYPPGKDNNMTKGGWKSFAVTLSKAGYNVFQFDWRGHGKSTDIKDSTKFWNLASPTDPNPNPWTGPWNTAKMIKGAPTAAVKKVKNELFFKDLNVPTDRYAPTLLLDLAAARYHLDSKNDGGDVNSSSIYLIGAETAATAGFAFLTTEWSRPAFAPTPNQLAINAPGAYPTYKYVPQPLLGGVTNEAGSDYSGAVWLSAARPTTGVADTLIKNWASKGAPKLRENNPMLFLYGESDDKRKKDAEFFYKEVLVAKPPAGSPLQAIDKLTYELPVKGSRALTGVGLLGQNLETEEQILKFLEARQKDRAKLIRKNRGFNAPWFIQLAGPAGFGFTPP